MPQGDCTPLTPNVINGVSVSRSSIEVFVNEDADTGGGEVWMNQPDARDFIKIQ